MTLNTTELICVAGVRFGTLMECRPFRDGRSAHGRKLYVEKGIGELLSGDGPESGFPHPKAQALIDRFLLGHMIGVSLEGNSSDQVELERLRDLDEVWVLCVRRPKPGWRIFGRFIARDCFVALRAFDRVKLGSFDSYRQHAKTTIAAWDALFPKTPPLRGRSIADYLGGELWRDMDDDR